MDHLKEGVPEADGGLRRMLGRKPSRDEAAFVPITLKASPVEIELPNGRVVRLPLGIGQVVLVEVIRAVGALKTLEGAQIMIDFSDVRIFLCTTPTHMNCSFDHLMGRAEEIFEQDPCSGHLFLFVNRSRDRIKILFWDHDGFCIFYKRLERGTFQMLTPTNDKEGIELDYFTIGQAAGRARSENGPPTEAVSPRRLKIISFFTSFSQLGLARFGTSCYNH